MNCASYPSRF
jgi:hypothetical protein